MAVYRSPFVNLAVETGIYASGDALGEKNSVTLPEHGVIMAVVAQDRDKEDVDFDIVMFLSDITGTTDNAAFDPTDAELNGCLGSITVTGYKDFNDNAIATVDNVGLPYWATDGNVYFQCVTRGTPTYTATTDLSISFMVVH